MKELRYSLLTDGSSDRALVPILSWLLREHQVQYPIQEQWADLRRLRRQPESLSERIKVSLDLYPCDLLFVHRDAEKEPLKTRVQEIEKALEDVTAWDPKLTVCVIPVRMMEAWLLLDEKAIRRASGNPHGHYPLRLPSIRRLERFPNPKQVLYELLRQASGLTGRRQKDFPFAHRTQLIAEFMETFLPLRKLSAFRALEEEVKRIVREQGWAEDF